MKIWKYRPHRTKKASQLAETMNIPAALAQVLVDRGFEEAEQARSFLYADYKMLSRPFMLPNMGAAVERIGDAIATKKKIAIFGDYDVDGICASTVLKEAFSWLKQEVKVYVPNRFKEGYGMHESSLEVLRQEGYELIITVDNGIASEALISDYQLKGLDFIVTDHHELPEKLPNCIIVNPKLDVEQNKSYSQICGCGVAYFLAMGMLIRLAPNLYDEWHQKALLDLVAIATVADVMPLKADNRIFVREGLHIINQGQRPGLEALIERAVGQAEVNAERIAFQIAPCINASGRLGKEDIALTLLERGCEEPERFADILVGLNETRKDIERQITAVAKAQVKEKFGVQHCIVVFGDDWHEGVIGIVAGRLAEQYHCPTFVFTLSDKNPDIYKGSARSGNGFHLQKALQKISTTTDCIESCGGHAEAAGVSVRKEKMPTFIQAIEEEAKQVWHLEDHNPNLWIDNVLKLDDIDDELYDALQLLEPCGQQNDRPVFALEHQRNFDTRVIGKDSSHLKLNFQRKEQADVEAIAFRRGDYDFSKNQFFDFAFQLSENCFRETCKVQLQIVDIQPSFRGSDDLLRHQFMEFGQNYVELTGFDGLAERRSFFTKIRGVTFEDRQKRIELLSEGDTVQLLRDYENPVDLNAIACLDRQHHQIGYLSRAVAAQLAPLMDLGAVYEAKVASISGGGEKQLGVNLQVQLISANEEQKEKRYIKQSLEQLSDLDLQQYLLDVFIEDGELHELQEKAIKAIVDEKQSVAVIMPTGRGKSLIYQLSAAVLAIRERKTTLVISPLKALIQDQYLILKDKLEPLGLQIRMANSDLNSTQYQDILTDIDQNNVDILLMTPEFFVKNQARFLKHKVGYAQIVVDEAHYLLSRRSAYKALLNLQHQFDQSAWVYLTATVPPTEAAHFRQAIVGAKLFVDDYIRSNLKIVDQRRTQQKIVYLYRLLMHRDKTICYVNSRKQAFELARQLRSMLPYQLRSIVYYYHGGLPHQVRHQVETAFKEGEIELLIATTAFGEGIHIGDIRNVVLYHPCFSIEAFNQLSGRCARDGEAGNIHLLYDEKDFSLNEMIISDYQMNRSLLGQMYVLLKKCAEETDFVIEGEPRQVYDRLMESHAGYSASKWRIALEIFSELGFIKRQHNDNQLMLEILQQPTHRQLEESTVFLEAESEARALAEYEKIAFHQDIHGLEEIIRTALYPEEWRNEEV